MAENDFNNQRVCPAVGSQEVNICLPVMISPFSVAGPAKIECCGAPVIDHSGRGCCGKAGATCQFTISQKIKVDVPVEFGANVKVGETFVDCGKTDVGCGCKDDYRGYDMSL